MLSITKYIIAKSFYFKAIILSVLLAVITFSDLSPIFTIGIDPSYEWAYNYFFYENIMLSKDIIFPQGPLAFLQYPIPLGNNLLIAESFSLITKILFVINILFLYRMKKEGIMLPVLISLILLNIFNLHLLLIGIVLSACLNFLNYNKHFNL